MDIDIEKYHRRRYVLKAPETEGSGICMLARRFVRSIVLLVVHLREYWGASGRTRMASVESSWLAVSTARGAKNTEAQWGYRYTHL